MARTAKEKLTYAARAIGSAKATGKGEYILDADSWNVAMNSIQGVRAMLAGAEIGAIAAARNDAAMRCPGCQGTGIAYHEMGAKDIGECTHCNGTGVLPKRPNFPRCLYCDIMFATQEAFESHVREEHGPKGAGSAPMRPQSAGNLRAEIFELRAAVRELREQSGKDLEAKLLAEVQDMREKVHALMTQTEPCSAWGRSVEDRLQGVETGLRVVHVDNQREPAAFPSEAEPAGTSTWVCTCGHGYSQHVLGQECEASAGQCGCVKFERAT